MDEQTNQIKALLENTISQLSEMNRDEMFATTATLDSILIRHYSQDVAYKSDLKSIRSELSMLINSSCYLLKYKSVI